MKKLPIDIFSNIKTPIGGDFITCPLCNKWIDVNENIFMCKIDITENHNYTLFYAQCCNILFDTWCTAISRGCTDDEYNTIIVSKYEVKENNIDNFIFDLFVLDKSEYKFEIDDFQYLSKNILEYLPTEITNIYEKCPQFESVQELKKLAEDNQIKFLKLQCNCSKKCVIDLSKYKCNISVEEE